jgi:signal transduction histidine kinase
LNGYLLIPLLAATVSTVLAVAILALDPRGRMNRRASMLVAGAAWWALCEVLWNTASDPEVALALVRISCLGWVALGPLGLDVLLDVAGESGGRARRALPWLYGLSALYVVLSLGGFIHERVVPTPWGFGYVMSPAYLLFYPFVVGCLLSGLLAALRALRTSSSAGERAQLRWLVVGVALPLVVASVTDGILPLFDIQVVHLGTSSFAFLGATVAWSFHRYGYSVLAPTAFDRELLHTIPEGIALLGLDGRIRSVNPEMARILGCPAERALGVPLGERLRGRPADDPAEAVAFDCRLETLGDGGTVPVSAAWRTLRDKQGLAFGRVVVLRDTREVVDLRRRLVTAGRLAAVGELAAGIAHEINNPIAFVRSNLGTLREYWAELSRRAGDDAADLVRDGGELIDECREGIERVGLIVHDVKSFAHSGEERSFVDVNALLESALRVAHPQLPPNARLERIFSDVPHLHASARHLQQVFLNLLTNACHAIGPQGTIRVQTARAGDAVRVRITDDGCGMAPEVLERVFDPFFTTKGVGEGTGLGLAITYQIVRSHGGDVGIESAPGQGTRVEILLPTDGAPEGVEAEAQTNAPAGR